MYVNSDNSWPRNKQQTSTDDDAIGRVSGFRGSHQQEYDFESKKHGQFRFLLA